MYNIDGIQNNGTAHHGVFVRTSNQSGPKSLNGLSTGLLTHSEYSFFIEPICKSIGFDQSTRCYNKLINLGYWAEDDI